MTLVSAALKLNKSERHLRHLCQMGRIPSAIQYGTLWTVIVEDGKIDYIPAQFGRESSIKPIRPRGQYRPMPKKDKETP